MYPNNSGTRRLAGITAIGGSAVFMAANLLHPRPDSFEGGALISLIVSSDIWMPLHLVAAAGVLGMLAGLVLLTFTFERDRARITGALAATAAVVGAALAIVNFAVIDGIAMKAVAVAWATAPASEQSVAFRIASAVEELDFASVELAFSVFFGLTFLLIGLAVALDGRRAFGWSAAAPGALTFAAAVLPAFIGASTAAVTPVIGLTAILTAWEIVLGVSLLRPEDRSTLRAEVRAMA